MKQVSLRQLEILTDFMEKHKALALGRLRGKEASIKSTKLWTELAAMLNCETLDSNLFRTPKEWNKFYNDYKCRIKNKARKFAQSQQKTGGGPADAPPLTELEERLCAILGEKFHGLPVRQNPVPSTRSCEETNQNALVEQPSPVDIEFDPDSMEFLASEPAVQIVEQQSTAIPAIDSSPDGLPAHPPVRQPISSKSNQNSTAREHKETEVQKAKDMLAEIEKARLEINQAQIKAQLERNNIEKNKVEAINNLASAAWALVNIFNNEKQGKTKQCAESPILLTRKRARSPSSESE